MRTKVVRRRLRRSAVAALVAAADDLAWRITRKWVARNRGVDPQDVHAAAVVGLVVAARRFDPKAGKLFPAFARLHAEREARELCRREASRGVHVPKRLGFVRVVVGSLSDLATEPERAGLLDAAAAAV